MTGSCVLRGTDDSSYSDGGKAALRKAHDVVRGANLIVGADGGNEGALARPPSQENQRIGRRIIARRLGHDKAEFEIASVRRIPVLGTVKMPQ